MKTLTIRTGESVEDFFRHGRELARLADQQLPLPEEYVISFEDPADLLALLNTDRLAVMWAIKNETSSIAGISEQLQRERSLVERDVIELERAGLVKIDAHTGQVHKAAMQIKLEAVLA
jgi:predicted transcriptional regulator